MTVLTYIHRCLSTIPSCVNPIPFLHGWPQYQFCYSYMSVPVPFSFIWPYTLIHRCPSTIPTLLSQSHPCVTVPVPLLYDCPSPTPVWLFQSHSGMTVPVPLLYDCRIPVPLPYGCPTPTPVWLSQSHFRMTVPVPLHDCPCLISARLSQFHVCMAVPVPSIHPAFHIRLSVHEIQLWTALVYKSSDPRLAVLSYRSAIYPVWSHWTSDKFRFRSENASDEDSDQEDDGTDVGTAAAKWTLSVLQHYRLQHALSLLQH